MTDFWPDDIKKAEKEGQEKGFRFGYDTEKTFLTARGEEALTFAVDIREPIDERQLGRLDARIEYLLSHQNPKEESYRVFIFPDQERTDLGIFKTDITNSGHRSLLQNMRDKIKELQHMSAEDRVRTLRGWLELKND